MKKRIPTLDEYIIESKQLNEDWQSMQDKWDSRHRKRWGQPEKPEWKEMTDEEKTEELLKPELAKDDFTMIMDLPDLPKGFVKVIQDVGAKTYKIAQKTWFEKSRPDLSAVQEKEPIYVSPIYDIMKAAVAEEMLTKIFGSKFLKMINFMFPDKQPSNTYTNLMNILKINPSKDIDFGSFKWMFNGFDKNKNMARFSVHSVRDNYYGTAGMEKAIESLSKLGDLKKMDSIESGDTQVKSLASIIGEVSDKNPVWEFNGMGMKLLLVSRGVLCQYGSPVVEIYKIK